MNADASQVTSVAHGQSLGTQNALSAKAPASRGAVRAIGPGAALHLGRLGGELKVLSGSVWLTCDGDLGDHRLQAGERMLLAIDDRAVIESWDAADTACIEWKPRHQSFLAAVLAEPLRVLAFLAGRLANGCAALARRAATSARWAEGCIDAGGERGGASSSGC